MAKLNLLVHINAYEDQNPSNDPSKNNVKWTNEAQGLSIEEPESKSLSLPSGQSHTLFSGNIAISADATTTWDLELVSTSVYRLVHNAGTAPNFRVARSTGADATTEITVTKNASLLTFTSSAGTPLALILGGATIGDEVRIAAPFASSNQGKFKILSLNATSFVVQNNSGVAETQVLGVDFAESIEIFSANGVQVGQKVDIVDGFSPVTFGTYEIKDVNPNWIEFVSGMALPLETNVSNNPEAIVVYNNAKQFLYLETNQTLDVVIDGDTITTHALKPMCYGSSTKPGILMLSASIKSVSITNTSVNTAKVFYVTAE